MGLITIARLRKWGGQLVIPLLTGITRDSQFPFKEGDNLRLEISNNSIIVTKEVQNENF